MARPVPKIKIAVNLLYSQGIALKLPAKILRWLLSAGRYIGIIVEILVLVTFAARFKLDGDLAEVNESINRQIPYIENYSSDIDSIKTIQFKLSVVKNNFDEAVPWGGILNKFASLTPKTTSFNSLYFEKSKTNEGFDFKLNGQSISNNDLSLLLYGLKKDSGFQDVHLANLTFDASNLIFTITGAVK